MRSAVLALAIVCGAVALGAGSSEAAVIPKEFGILVGHGDNQAPVRLEGGDREGKPTDVPMALAQVRELKHIAGGLVGLASEGKRPNDQDRAQSAQNGRKPRREYLFFGGIGSPYLGVQILGIVLAAFSLSALAGFSLFRAFDNGDSKRLWLPVASLSGLVGLFFWGWAWAGNPLSAWGLAP